MPGATTAARNPSRGIQGVEAEINYIRPPATKPRHHANDSSLDTVVRDPRKMFIEDGRTWPVAPTIEGEGFQLVRHVVETVVPLMVSGSQM